jgi:replicative DNA helicase
MKTEAPFKGKNVVFQDSAVSASAKRFKEARTREAGLYGFDCGIHDINMACGGFRRKEIITIAARSGHGKTAMIIPMLHSSIEPHQGKVCYYMFFSWELSPDYVQDRIISYMTGISNKELTQGAKYLPPSKVAEVERAYEASKNVKAFYQSFSTNIAVVKNIMEEFCALCAEESKRLGIEILPVGVIDYIGMAEVEGTKAYGIGDFMNQFKAMCNRLGCAGCILGQINRVADSEALPELQNIKDSGDIENASDVVILGHRPEKAGVEEFPNGLPTANKIMLRVMKNRNGGTGDVISNCHIAFNRIWHEGHTFDYNYRKDYESEAFWRKELGL